MSDTSCEQVTVAGSDSVKKVPKSRKKFNNALTIRLIAAAKAALAAPETGVARPLPVGSLRSCWTAPVCLVGLSYGSNADSAIPDVILLSLFLTFLYSYVLLDRMTGLLC